MGISRRPELEKDNPVAPQMYVGPRRRLALARASVTEPSYAGGGMTDALQALAMAAERFVKRVPVSQNRERERKALLKAIAEANGFLIR